jgi:two-component system, cell cycle sensor histidine kinase and response regulator CckA
LLESLGLVAGGIAHDFNNLLVSVLAEASAAREEKNLSENTRESLRRIEAAARRMAQLTRQLLAFSGRAAVVTVPIDADDLVAEIGEPLAQLIRPELSLSIARDALGTVVEADRGLLRQVIFNLVSNASDAAAAKVHVATRINLMPDGVPAWQLEISDDGPGIDSAALPRIFEPFFSTKSGHHGLGLSAVHGIVQRLGGDVQVDTRPGGTRFTVRLPVAIGVEAARTRTSSELMVPIAKLEGVHVLVADDEPSVRATVRRLLERRGATVVVASDGTEAEDRLRAEPFQLVITDVAMPGATGYDVLAVARETQPGVRVILMSGYTEKLRGDGSEYEPDAFLEKPFAAKTIDAMIDEVMKGR